MAAPDMEPAPMEPGPGHSNTPRGALTLLSIGLVLGGCDLVNDPQPSSRPFVLAAGAALPDSVPWAALGSGRLVFERESSDGWRVCVLDAEVGTSWTLHTATLVGGVAVSPDGAELALTALPPDWSLGDPWALWTVAAAGGEPSRVVPNSGPSASPGWAPGGTELLFHSQGNVRVTIRSVSLAEPPSDTSLLDFFGAVEGPIAVGPSRQLLFAGVRCPPSEYCEQGIYTVVPGDSAPRLLILPPDSATLGSPAWSPDGTTIAYLELAHRDTLALTRVRLAAADGSNPRTVVELSGIRDPVRWSLGSNERGLAWSPDGEAIAFNHYDRDLVAWIWVVKTDGSGLARVTSAEATDHSLSWSR